MQHMHNCIIKMHLPSRLATIEAKPVPAPISSTALSIRFTCCWLFSKNWHKAIAYKNKILVTFATHFQNEPMPTAAPYPRPDQSTVRIHGLSDADVMTGKMKRLISPSVINTRLPEVPPAQSLFCHHPLVCQYCMSRA